MNIVKKLFWPHCAYKSEFNGSFPADGPISLKKTGKVGGQKSNLSFLLVQDLSIISF